MFLKPYIFKQVKLTFCMNNMLCSASASLDGPKKLMISYNPKTDKDIELILEKAKKDCEEGGGKFIISHFIRTTIRHYGEQIWGIKNE